MSAILAIDETSGIQNLQGALVSNDISVASIPTEFSTALAAAVPAGQSATPLGLALSGNGTATTTDDLIQAFGGNVSEVAFTINGGNGADSALTTTGGRMVHLYVDGSNNNVVYGREAMADGTADAAGRIVFACFLDTMTAAAGDAGSTGARLWLAQYLPMFHPDETSANDIVTLSNKLNVSVNNLVNFSLEGAPSGQNLFLMFGDGTPTATDTTIIVTGKNGGTVNTGQGGGMTTIGSNNQMIDPNEGMFFTFVKGANVAYTVPNLDQNEADVAANIDFDTYFGATAASFGVVQLQPPKGGTLLVTAILNSNTTEKGNTYIAGLPFSSGEEVNITSVTITRGVTSGKTTVLTDYVFNPAVPASLTQAGITLDFSGNTAKVTGVIAGDRVKYTTATDHNRVLIDNVGNSNAKLNSAFDIGGFRLESGALTSTPLGDIDMIDDAPSAAAVLAAGAVRHDETAGLQADADDVTGPIAAFAGVANASGDMGPGYATGSASVIDSSTSAGGFDGLKTTAYSLDVSAANVDSGLDTTEGQDILLNKEGALVVGRISGGANDGKAAFAVSIDAATGVLSMVQYHSIKHPTGGSASPDESLSIANAALLAIATVTDGDDDPASASVAVGARVSFQDDGPAASAVLGAGLVRHDETAGSALDPSADDVPGPLTEFNGIANKSTDMTAGFASGGASVIDSSASTGGVDGIAGTVYSLGVSAAGVDSGLDTTEGQNILLNKEGDLVVGRISGGANDTKAAFAVAIDATTGVLTMVQYHSIRHPTGGASSPDESLSITNAALLAIATVTDGDGDTSAASVAIGAQVQIQDDGPSASAVLGAGAVRHDETVGNQADADDVTGPLAAFSGVATVSTDMAAAYATGTATVIDSSGSDGGVDGLASTAYSLDVSAPAVDSGLDSTEGADILLTKEGSLVVGRISGGANDGKAAFAIAIDASTGVLSMVQYHSVRHPTGGAASPDESLSLANAALVAIATVTDGDGDTSAASVAIGARVSIQDDGPTAAAALGAGSVAHDETAGLQGDANDVAGPLAAFAGVATLSTDMTAGYATGTASVVDSSASTGGVDGLASTAYTLDVASAGVDSGLDTTQGEDIVLTKEGDIVVGRISGGANNGKAAFAVSIDSATGILSMVQYNSIRHPTGGTGSPDESVAIAAGALLATATTTDGDGDTSVASVGIGARVQFQDDGPAINGVSDLIYANSSNPSPGGTGIFDYSIGVDDHKAPFSSSNSDFSGVALASGTVGVTPISNQSVTWASETLAQAVFNISFDYISNPGLNTTTTATGTLTFDKVADTYTLSMTAPIQSFTVLTTSNATQFIGYAQGTDSFVLDNTQPFVSVAELASNFFVQFSGYTEPGGGTGANNLRAGTNGAFVDGELFNQAPDWVSISGVAAGVAGDTIQKGEVLDLDFFQANPGGDTNDPATASAVGIFLKFDGINNEDLVVVLKLVSASDPTDTTTRAFVVDNSDIFKAGSTLPAGYNITLDNNDGTVIFESNDYNGSGEDYVIMGAQVLVSTEGITGNGINLNPAAGAAGGSSGMQAFGVSTTDNDVIKISDIGFLTSVTPDSHLVFNAAVVDADGDATALQVMDVTISSGSVFTAGADRESIQGRSGVADTFVFGSLSHSPAGALHDIISGFVSGTDKIDVSGIDANTGGGANDAFSFIGAAAFTAAGQLRFDVATNTLQGDTDGDGVADLVIELLGVNSLLAGDIVP